MKKVLLGLLALSATLMAESTGITGTAGENQIDITTKAFIVDSGLIITESENGTSAIKSIELDHGTIMKTNTAASSVGRDIYIRKNGTNKTFPTGSILEISLKSSGNDLTGPEDSKIPHTLTAIIKAENAIAAGAIKGQELKLAGSGTGSTSQTNQFATVSNANSVEVSLRSDIATGEINQNTNLAEGAYSNTSTLSVKFSKIPTVPGTPANSQPAGASR